MSLVLCYQQNFHLAEKMIRDAISLNSSMPDSWHILARVLDYQNDNQSSMKCYQTCLQLETSCDIVNSNDDSNSDTEIDKMSKKKVLSTQQTSETRLVTKVTEFFF